MINPIKEGQHGIGHKRQAILLHDTLWLAVTSHPHKEKVAVESLRRQDFSVYCPVVERQTRHARRTRNVLRPLFPGYIFVDATGSDGRWRSILYSLGVRGLVRLGQNLAYVPGELIDSLRAREVDGVVKRPFHPFAIGQSVRMQGGAFSGLAAKIIEMDESDRLVVLMELLNQVVRVKIDLRQIEVC